MKRIRNPSFICFDPVSSCNPVRILLDSPEPRQLFAPPTEIDALPARPIDYPLARDGLHAPGKAAAVWEVHRLNPPRPMPIRPPFANRITASRRARTRSRPARPRLRVPRKPSGMRCRLARIPSIPTFSPALRRPLAARRELLRIALPLILSQSFMTVQVFVDTLLLSWHDPLEMAASFPAVMWYWLFFGVLQVTAGYTSTFVAQYTGANRPNRVGPAVWQGIHFAAGVGILFLVVVPLAPFLIAMGGHPPEIQKLETIYLKCLSFAALPMLVMAAVNGFFSGRGQTWTVLAIEAFGTAVNIALAMLLIFGRGGFPEMGIEGAGWATVIGSYAAASWRLVLMLRQEVSRPSSTHSAAGSSNASSSAG